MSRLGSAVVALGLLCGPVNAQEFVPVDSANVPWEMLTGNPAYCVSNSPIDLHFSYRGQNITARIFKPDPPCVGTSYLQSVYISNSNWTVSSNSCHVLTPNSSCNITYHYYPKPGNPLNGNSFVNFKASTPNGPSFNSAGFNLFGKLGAVPNVGGATIYYDANGKVSTSPRN